MPREELQHVIEEADPGADVVASFTVDGQAALDLRFSRSPVECRRAGPVPSERSESRGHRSCLAATTDSRASMAAFVCSTTPAVMRTQPGVDGSFDRSRT